MKVVWITIPTELEVDLWRAAQDHPDVTLRQYVVSGLVSGPGYPPYYHDGAQAQTREDRVAMLERAAAEDADLYVFRYPLWVHALNLWADVARLFDGRPAVAWISEQGPTVQDAMQSAVGWRHVAVNHRADLDRYRAEFPEAQLHVLPFGAAAWTPEECAPDEEYRADFVVDGGPHYACGEHAGWKQRSVDVMVRPLVEAGLDVAAWGPTGSEHGWSGVPWLGRRFRGYYDPSAAPRVYGSARVYVGISWNWGFSGYGMKLARALASGIPVLWHRTPGMAGDGLVEGVHLMCSSSPEETLCAAQWLLGNEEAARRIGAAGRDFALAQWEWGENLKRLAAEVSQ